MITIASALIIIKAGWHNPYLCAGYRLMSTRRRQAPFGVVVASTAEGSGKIIALIALEDVTAEEGSNRFYSVRMRCTLRVC